MSDSSSRNIENAGPPQGLSVEASCGSELEALKQELYETKKRLAEQEALNSQISCELKERMKELNCHNRITMLFDNRELTPDEFFQSLVDTIPEAFQFPDIASVMLRVHNREYFTAGFCESDSSLQVELKKDEVLFGVLKVCYKVDEGKERSSPFLKEEEELLQFISRRILKYIGLLDIVSELREKEQLSRSFFESSPDLIVIADLDSKVVSVSSIVVKMFGGDSVNTYIGRSILDFIIPSQHERALRIISELVEGKLPGSEEYRAIRLDGTVFDIDVNLAVLKDAAGSPQMMMLIVRDITARKKTEARLRSTEILFRKMVESINDAIYEVSPEGIVTYVSPAIKRILGYEPSEIIGRSFLRFMHPDDRPVLINAFSDMGSRDYSELQYRYLTKDGELRWVRSSTEPIVEDGLVVGGRGILTDIHSQKMAELSLKASEHRLRMLFERMPQGVIYQDVSGVVTAVNPAAERITGLTMRQIQEKTYPSWKANLFREDGSFLPPEEYPSMEAFRTGRPVRDMLIRFHNTVENETRWVMVSSEPEFREGEEKPFQVFTTITDITGIKQIERELISQKNHTESLLAAIPDQMFILNAEGVFLDFKPGKEEESAFQPDEFLNRNVRDVLPVNLSAKLIEDIRLVMDGKPTAPVQYEIMVSDRLRYREGKMSPFGDDKVIVMVSDISWRVAADRALRDSEERLRNLLNSQTSYVLRTDLRGRFTYWNPKYEKDFCQLHPSGILEGSNVELSVSDQHRQRLNDAVRLCIAEPGSIVKVELDTPAGAGGAMTTLWELLCFTYECGNPSGVQYVGIDITDRKMAERRLMESEEKYRSLIDSSDAVIAMIDRDGRYLYLNEIAAAPFGKRPDEMIGLTVHDLFIPAQADMMMAAISEVFRNNNGIIRESPVDLAGENRWLRTSLQPVRDESGAPCAVMVHSMNITEMKNAEIRLRQSEENYRNLFYNSPDGYLIIRDGKFIDCNKVSAEMIGCDRSMIISRTPAELSPEYQPCGRRSDDYAPERIREACQKGEHSFEWTHRRLDGSEFLVQVSLVVMDYEQDTVLLTTWRDITVQRRSELQIRKLSQVVEQSPVYIVITDPDGTIEYANASLLEKTGYSIDEIIGQNPRILKSGFHSDEFYKDLWDTVLSGRDWKGQLCNRTKRGELYWERASISPIMNEGGKVINLVAVKQDFTEQMKIEKSIADSEARMRAITDSALDAIVMLDPDDCVSFWNPAAEKIFGYEKDEILGRNLYETLKPLDAVHNVFSPSPDDWRNAGGGRVLEMTVHHKSGREINIELSLSMINKDDRWHSIGIMRDVTDRKAAEEELRKFRTITDQATYGCTIVSPDGILLYSNDAFARMHGWEVSDIIGRNFSMLHTDEQMEKVREAIELLKSQGGFKAREIWRKRKDGSVFPSLMNAKMILDANGQPQFMSATATDISEIKRNELALLESEARLNDAQELAEMGSWEYDVRTCDVKWSRNYYRLMGRDPSEKPFTSEEIKNRAHPDDRDLFDIELQKCREGQSSGSFTYRLNLSDGDMKCIQSHIFPRFEDSEIVSVRGISLDVTEKVRKEEEIRKLTLAIEQSPVVFLITDLDGTVTYASPAFSRLTGYASDEIKGRDVRILASEETSGSLYEELWRSVTAGRLWQGEWLGRKKNGEYYPERVVFCPIHDGREQIVSCLCIKEDLTMQKKAQDDKVARQAAEQANQAKSVFLANMSHEIRTPLNAIIGFSQILKRDATLSGSHLEHVQTILRSGEHLLALINDVLDLSKIEAGHVRLNPVEFSLDELLNSLEPMFRVRLRDKGLQFVLERSPGMPDFVVADEGKLKQVLINLVGNAVKFTRRGRVSARFRTEADPGWIADGPGEAGGRLRLFVEVEDTGPGISEADKERIFESFHQTEAGRAAGGTGLGLTISRTLIGMMGGRISVESREGQGSVFRFDIAVKQVSDLEPHRDEIPAANVTGLAPGTGPFRILAVDDNIDNLRLVKAMLEPVGFQVRTAGDGAEGLTVFEEWSPHAVLMDIRMPVMDGYEAIKRIKATAKGRATLVIALTASAFESDSSRILSIGADDHLRKPFQIQSLLAKLSKLPGLHYRQEEPAPGTSDDNIPDIPSGSEIEKLPEQLVSSMRQALEMGNMAQLRELVAQAGKTAPSIADGLMTLVRKYDYDRLSDLLAVKGGADFQEGFEQSRVMIVDDTPANLSLLETLLRANGYEVACFPSGAPALRAASHHPPDLILLDIMMPDMNGFDVCRRLRGDPALREIPVIFISALDDAVSKVKAFTEGGVDYVTKPPETEEVLARVKTHISMRRQQMKIVKQKEQLQSSLDALRDLEEQRDQLVHMIVHDMRSPLMGIVLASELLELKLDELHNEELLGHIRSIMASSNRLKSMVVTLLDISRMEAREMPLKPQRCSMHDVVSAAIVSLGPLIGECNLVYEPPDKNVTAFCDLEITQRIVENLLGNAAKFSGKGGTIRLEIAETVGNVKVSVHDTGPGVPPEFYGLIFQKFGQAPLRARDKRYSTGLGLAFCKLAVEAQGGHIGVQSEVGKGSTFWFTLPLPDSAAVGVQ